jgi:ubiquinone/menaquinone biosynthesis C-methylase UbiE
MASQLLWRIQMTSHHGNKHIHPGRPSSVFFNSNQVLNQLEIDKGDYILDAGCGNGYISLAASEIVGEKGNVFAIDIDEQSINALKSEIDFKNIKNIKAIKGDISDNIPLDDGIIDVCLMVNVFHGLVENNEVDAAMKEIKRVQKNRGKLFIIEFKKIESTPGPPLSVRLAPQEIERILKNYNYQMKGVYNIGSVHYGNSFINL